MQRSLQVAKMQSVHGYGYTFQGVPVVFPYNAYDVQVRSAQLSDDLALPTPLHYTRELIYPRLLQKNYMDSVIRALQQVRDPCHLAVRAGHSSQTGS